LQLWSRKTLKSLVVPGGILLMGIAVLAHSGWLTLPLPALSFLFYCALIGGMLLAWRFHSTRVFSALIILFLAQQAVEIFGAHVLPGRPGLTGLQAVAVLVPLDFVLIALMTERGFSVSCVAPVGLLLFVESVVVAVLCRAQGAAGVPPRLHHVPPANFLPSFGWMAFALAGIFLLARTLYTRKPADSALLWSLAAFFLSLRFTGTPRISTLYSASAAFILATAIIENSYLLAYHDELTTLPSRRAFNDALQRLQHPYTIAVVDIDHFKRFNDTYGHDTGDQVLRLVATNLSRVTGGGQAYRCGGEEFSILFPGKTNSEVATHLEQLRATIETSEFRMRSGDRREAPRGPDRRNRRIRTRGPKGHAIRQLAQDKPAASLSVTVSIGAAASTSDETNPDTLVQAADKALYRAKANGRNRVEIATSPRPRTRVKAAGIA
jgi:GGDEF domain-containing protein